MANLYKNVLKVRNDKALNSVINALNGEFDFNHIHEIPTALIRAQLVMSSSSERMQEEMELRKVLDVKYGYNYWVDYVLDHWGSTVPYNVVIDRIKNTITFNTEYGTPIKALLGLSNRVPGIKLVVDYKDEVNADSGHYGILDGQLVDYWKK